MEPDELKLIVTEAIETAMSSHPCWMSEDDRSMTRDLISGGRIAKKSILTVIVGGLLYISAKLILSVEKFNPFK